MLVLKGFAENLLFANNTVGITNAIGELSTQSLTYSREIGYYVSDIAPKVSLVSFLSAVDGVKQPVSIDLRDHVITVINWIYGKITASSNQLYADEFLTDILNQFQTVGSNFQCGAIVSDGTNEAPEWVSWTRNGDPANSLIKIWFSDPSFQKQYDEYEILVVAPVTNVDDFFLRGSDVEAELKGFTTANVADKIQNAKNGCPETILRAESYNYYDQLNSARVLNTDWFLLIYGAAGNNIDSIKDALQNYILSNSTHTRDEWIKLLPDIFKRTEFVIIPQWDQYAIPDRASQTGIYSPQANLYESMQKLVMYAYGYDASHINSHAITFGHPYKSMNLLSIGSIQNRDNLFELPQVYPDYIAVSSLSQDFNRMATATRSFAETLEIMLVTAESMSLYTDIPAGMTKVVRNGLLYLVATLNNIHYLVMAKSSMVYGIPANGGLAAL